MTLELRVNSWRPPLFALLAAACSNVPEPGAGTPPPDDEQMSTPPDGTGGSSAGGPSSPPSVARPCDIAGLAYAHGSSIPAADSCNTCLCYDGSIVCTAVNCAPPSADAGMEADADAGAPVIALPCEVAGQSFADGDEVPSGDDCNTCTCGDGRVACSELVCNPVFCAEFVEEPDAVCSRFPLDPCIAQDPDCGGVALPAEP